MIQTGKKGLGALITENKHDAWLFGPHKIMSYYYGKSNGGTTIDSWKNGHVITSKSKKSATLNRSTRNVTSSS
jgi:hypothetical protein